MGEVTKRYAVVTGANKGIGFEACRQSASNGVIKCQFGKLDILVNNAGISGLAANEDAFSGFVKDGVPIKWDEILSQTHEIAEKCLQTSYYGAKGMCEALVPLQLSDSPRIVNVSSAMGKLKNVTNEWDIGVFRDAENFTEERVGEVGIAA